jgi:quercetin dioxygenase-like cupin family protein
VLGAPGIHAGEADSLGEEATVVREGNQLVHSAKTEWLPLREPGVTGVFVKVLRFDKAAGRAPTILLRFQAGAIYPPHNHPGGEEIFVLEGDVWLGGDHLHAGDYLYTAPQNKHAVKSDGGCVLLVVVPEEVEVLGPGDGEAAHGGA